MAGINSEAAALPSLPPNHRRGSLPNLSKSPFGLSKLLSPVSLSLCIDNPIIFLHPKPLPAFEPSQEIRQLSNLSTSSRQNSRRGSHTTTPPNELYPEPPLALPPSSFNSTPSGSVTASDDEHRTYAIDNRGTVLSGTLLLKLLKPKELKKIVISLWGQSYIGFNDRPYEHQTILAKDIEVDLTTQLLHMRSQHPNPGTVSYNRDHKTYLLDKGDYWFGWSFILPPYLPPYERGQFGRTTHKVIAKVKFASGLGLGVKGVGKNLSSMLVGVGGGGHELETESYFVAICNPAGSNEEMSSSLDLDFQVTDVSEHLGPYTVSATSAYFTVAGLLSFKFRLNEIPQKGKVIKIYKITCFIKQQYRLISMKDKDAKTGTRAESWPPCQRRKVFVLDHSNVHELDPVYSNGEPVRNAEGNPDLASDSSNHRRTSSDAIADTHSPFSARDLVASTRASSQSRSRSRIRDLMMTSRDQGTTERTEHLNQQNHPWSSLSHLFHGHRREDCPRQSSADFDTPESRPRLWGTHSTDRLLLNQPSSPRPTDCDRHSHELLSPDCLGRINHGHTNSNAPSSGGYQSNNHFSSSTTSFQQDAEQNDGNRHENVDIDRSLDLPRLPASPTLPSTSSPHIRRGRPLEAHSDAKIAQLKKCSSSRSRGRKSAGRDRHGLGPGESEKEIPLITLTDEHMSWDVQHTGRLPNDDIIRPSTQPGTHTNIHIFHTLIFEISYSVEDAEAPTTTGESHSKQTSSQGGALVKRHSENKSLPRQPAPVSVAKKVLSIGKPVQIYSCCCMVESMVLPPYSRSDPHPEIVQHPTPQHAARMVKCVCGMSTEVLLKTLSPLESVHRTTEFQSQATWPENSQCHEGPNQPSRITSSRLEYRVLPNQQDSEQQASRIGSLLDGYPGPGFHPWSGNDYGLPEEDSASKQV